jgi:hypothetical protein
LAPKCSHQTPFLPIIVLNSSFSPIQFLLKKEDRGGKTHDRKLYWRKRIIDNKKMQDKLQEQLKSFLKGVIFDYHNNNLNQSEVKQEVLDYIFEGKGGDNKFFENYIDFIDQNFIGKEAIKELQEKAWKYDELSK